MNIGEWSEFYAFLKLLADGEVYGADARLEKVQEWKYPVRSILRENTSNVALRYVVCHEQKIITVELAGFQKEIPQAEILTAARKLLDQIKSEKSFTEPCIRAFIEEMCLPKIKAKSGDKNDITVVLHDMNIGREQEFGFSIKSTLGGDSTLLNASQATNFVYEILHFDALGIDEKEAFEGLKGRKLVSSLLEKGCELEFLCTDENFGKNLRLVDSKLDDLCAHLARLYYSQEFLDQKLSKISDLADFLEAKDPLAFHSRERKPYVYKIKQLLSVVALGLTPTAVWTGIYDANGGYLIVKADGSLVCYHIYNWNAFQDYLFEHTYLDTPSTTRHRFCKLYQENGKAYIKLNLQIRFHL